MYTFRCQRFRAALPIPRAAPVIRAVLPAISLNFVIRYFLSFPNIYYYLLQSVLASVWRDEKFGRRYHAVEHTIPGADQADHIGAVHFVIITVAECELTLHQIIPHMGLHGHALYNKVDSSDIFQNIRAFRMQAVLDMVQSFRVRLNGETIHGNCEPWHGIRYQFRIAQIG